MNKTTEQILERIESPESIDFYNVQRSILISFLSFEDAKPFLSTSYVENYDELPDDEKWVVGDPKESLMLIFPVVYHLLDRDNFMETKKGLLVLKTLMWLVDEEYHNEVEHYFMEPTIANMEIGIKEISKHFGYSPTIENIEFEEISE